MENSTIVNNYKNSGLKNDNIAAKISSLQRSWVKRLFEFHIIQKSLGKNFVFHSNLQVNQNLTKNFAKYYRDIINN